MIQTLLPDHAWIAARIPHQGSMCLLDRVLAWDASSIDCCANSHHHSHNPLRHANRLGVVNGIEYAAQAMAVHGALLAGTNAAPAAGFLTSVRNVIWHSPTLDTAGAELLVHAERLSASDQTILYAFSLHSDERCLLTGRATVLLDAGKAKMQPLNQEKPSS